MGASASAKTFLKQGRPVWNRLTQDAEPRSEIKDYGSELLRYVDPILFPNCCSKLQVAWIGAEREPGVRGKYKQMCILLEERRSNYNTTIAVLNELLNKKGDDKMKSLGKVITDIKLMLAVTEVEIDNLAFAFATSIVSGKN